MSDDLYEKTEALLKGLLSMKANSMRTAALKGQGFDKPKLPKNVPDIKPIKIKGPSVPQISTTPPKPKGLPTSPEKAAEAIKVPGGLPPAPKHQDPAAVAAQLKAPDKTALVKPKEEVLKVADNGQWSLEKRDLDPSHGITFGHEHHDMGGAGDLTHVRAHHPDGSLAGEGLFEHQPDGTLSLLSIQSNFQGQGVGTAVIRHAMNVTGKAIGSHTSMTPAGTAFKQKLAVQHPTEVAKLKPE